MFQVLFAGSYMRHLFELLKEAHADSQSNLSLFDGWKKGLKLVKWHITRD